MDRLTEDVGPDTAVEELEEMAEFASDWADVYEERGEYVKAMEAKGDASSLRRKAKKAKSNTKS